MYYNVYSVLLCVLPECRAREGNDLIGSQAVDRGRAHGTMVHAGCSTHGHSPDSTGLPYSISTTP